MSNELTVRDIVNKINEEINKRLNSEEPNMQDSLVCSHYCGAPTFAHLAAEVALAETFRAQRHKGYSCTVATTERGKPYVGILIRVQLMPTNPYAMVLGSADFSRMLIRIKSKRVAYIDEVSGEQRYQMCFTEAAPADGVDADMTISALMDEIHITATKKVSFFVQKIKVLKSCRETLGTEKFYEFLNACDCFVFDRGHRPVNYSMENYRTVEENAKTDGGRELKRTDPWMHNFVERQWKCNLLNPNCFSTLLEYHEEECARLGISPDNAD